MVRRNANKPPIVRLDRSLVRRVGVGVADGRVSATPSLGGSNGRPAWYPLSWTEKSDRLLEH